MCPALGHIDNKRCGPQGQGLGSWVFIPLAWPVRSPVRKSCEFCAWHVSPGWTTGLEFTWSSPFPISVPGFETGVTMHNHLGISEMRCALACVGLPPWLEQDLTWVCGWMEFELRP